jgi:F-type H+-transporting ATPase subunit b
MMMVLLSAGHGPTWAIEGWYLIDFLIFVGVIVWLVRKPLAEFVSSRRERIVADMKEARELRDQARAKLSEYENRLANLEQEIKQILNDARVAGEEERSRILSEATKTAERIRQDALARLDQERRKLEHQLQVQMVDMAVGSAEQKVLETIQDSDHARFIDEYVEQISAPGGSQ